MLEALSGSVDVLLGMGGLLVLSAFFSSAETAVFSLGWSGLQRLGPGLTTRRLESLLSDRRRLLVTILLGNLLVNVLYFNLGVLVSVRLEERGFVLFAYAWPVAVLVLLVLLGEILPKTAAVKWPARVARVAAEPLFWLKWLLVVPSVVLGAFAQAVVRVVAGGRPEEGELSPDELGALLELASREGHLGRGEHEALQAVLSLSEISVKKVMVPRVDILAFDLDSPGSAKERRDRFVELVREHRLNKILVSRGSFDSIEGFLDAKEVLGAPDKALDDLVHPVPFIPETAPVAMAIERLAAQGLRMMVVVDEYGGTAGLLTHEDLAETVVGDLSDESDEGDRVVSESDGAFLVDGGLGVSRMVRTLGLSSGDLRVSTIGGLVTLILGRLPKVGDRVRAGRVSLEVVSMQKHAPDRVRVSPLRRPSGPRSVVP